MMFWIKLTSQHSRLVSAETEAAVITNSARADDNVHPSHNPVCAAGREALYAADWYLCVLIFSVSALWHVQVLHIIYHNLHIKLGHV